MFGIFFSKGQYIVKIGDGNDLDVELNSGIVRFLGYFADVSTLVCSVTWHFGHPFISLLFAVLAVGTILEADKLGRTVQEYEVRRLLEDIHES